MPVSTIKSLPYISQLYHKEPERVMEGELQMCRQSMVWERVMSVQPTSWEVKGRGGCLAAALNGGRLDESQTQRGLSDVQCGHQSLEKE